MEKNDFLNECKRVKTGELTIKDFVENNIVYNYIPLSIKTNICAQAIEFTDYTFIIKEKALDKPIAEIITDYEIYKLFTILNLYFDTVIIDLTPENYDLCLQIGLLEELNVQTKGDFQRFLELYDKMSGVLVTPLYDRIMEVFNDLPNAEQLNNVLNALNSIDKNTLSQLQELALFNNPVMEELKVLKKQ